MRAWIALAMVTVGTALFAPPASAEFGFITQWGTRGAGDGQFELNTTGIAVDSNGDVLVNDNDNHRVERFSNAGAYLRQWATAANVGIGIAPNRTVYVGNRVPGGPEVDTYGTVGEFLGTFKQFPENLYDITVDPSGNVYAFTGSGAPNQIIKKFDAAGNLLAQWGTYGTADGQVTASGAYAIAADAAGNLFVADAGATRISKFDPNGNFLLKWGSPGSGPGQFGVIGTGGIGVDSAGTVWVTDPANSRVQHFDPNGNFLSEFGTNGRGPGQFDRPSDVAVDSAGNIFVMDQFNTRVQKWGEIPAPTPVQGVAVAAAPVSGTVLVRRPGTTTFVKLEKADALPIGTIVDARKGRIRITAIRRRITFTADFFEGQFQLAQKTTAGATMDLRLFGGAFRGCPAGLRSPRSLGSKKPKSVRHLWGEGSGPFRTVGRFSAATVRGTTWLTDDQCTGTLTRVTKGSVSVRDFVRRRTVLVSAGKRYFARARR